MRSAIFVSSLWFIFVASETFAETFRCGDRVVSTGDTKADVLTKCGDPTLVDSHEESITKKIDADTKRTVTVTIDEWTYDLGPDSFIRILRFENGQLTDIKTGGYGH